MVIHPLIHLNRGQERPLTQEKGELLSLKGDSLIQEERITVGCVLLVRSLSVMRYFVQYAIACLLFPSLLWGQYRFDKAIPITTKEGLPHNFVYDITEDLYGFIWIATEGGLVRYDGSRLIPFERGAVDSVPYPGISTRALLWAGDSLWIGSDRGLSIFNLRTGQLSNHRLDSLLNHPAEQLRHSNLIRDIIQDRQGNIWLAAAYQGFVKWDRPTRSFQFYPLPDIHPLSDQYNPDQKGSLIRIIQDVSNDSIMWATGRVGLLRLHIPSGTVERIRYPHGDVNHRYTMDRKKSLYQNSDRSIMTGSWNGGLSIYHPETGQYKQAGKIAPTGTFLMEHLHHILPRTDGRFYLTYDNGLYLYDPSNDQLALLGKNQFRGSRFSFGVSYVDSAQRMWYGSDVGAYLVDPIEQQFPWYSITALNDTDIPFLPRGFLENFYPGYLSLHGQYSNGIFHVNPTTEDRFYTPVSRAGLQEKPFSSWGMDQVDEQSLILSGNNGLYEYRKGQDSITYIIQSKWKATKRFSGVLTDQSGSVWLTSSAGGLMGLTPSDWTFRQYLGPEALVGGRTFRPFQDSIDNIWVLSDLGHLVYDRKRDELYQFLYANDSVRTFQQSGNFCACPNGEVWLAGYGEGIGQLSSTFPERGLLRKVPFYNGAGEPEFIISIACDANNNLWAGTRESLLKIRRTDWTFKSFQFDYGLPDWSGLFQFLENGKLFISGRGGFYLVDPTKLRVNTQAPIPYVIRLTTNKGPKGTLEDYLSRKPVSLRSDENVLTIEFSAINLTLSKHTRFEYQLEGIDETWVDPGDQRTVTYAYIPGGTYTFRLRASNNEGICGKEIFTLPLAVGTPWYKTIWFFLAIAACLLAIGYGYYQSRIHQIKQENDLKSTFERRVANTEMKALRAQMNPHFLFNCLNSIESYIIRNDTRKASEYLNRFGRLMRLILQNSRNSYVELSEELELLHLYIQLEQMRFRNRFSYDITLSTDLNPEGYEVPPMLIQPFVENAIWHGLNQRDAGGKVTIHVSKQADSLRCVVEDNGIGRVAAGKLRAAQKIKRKSMGMGITAERIDIINKLYDTHNEVTIEDLYDAKGQAAGTRVILDIPI